VAAILDDPEASDNDRGVALAMLRNAEESAHMVLPFCQDTGTATVFAKKGQQVWTGVRDEEYLTHGIWETYTKENLRYSQTLPLSMYQEKNSGTNLPAQIDLHAVDGMKYEFLFVAKGGGSANKTYLFQETKALLNPESLRKFLVEKMKSLGTAACPPYHLAFVIGGTSAETCLKTVKLASTGYLDTLPTSGDGYGRAFRDTESGAAARRGRLEDRHRRPVRRQVLRARRAGRPAAAPRRLMSRGHGGLVLGAPQHQGEDHEGRTLPRAARGEPGSLHSRAVPAGRARAASSTST
jgi:hypothetical protein